MIVGFGLNSEAFLNQAAKIGIAQSGLDIKYGSIKGGLYSGLSIKDFDFQDGDVKADLTVDMDMLALKDGKVKIHDINLSNFHIDKDFLSSLLTPSDANKSATKGESFIKTVQVDSLHLDTHDIVYEGYELHGLVLDVKDFKSDLKTQFFGDIKAKIDSNVAKADVLVILDDNRYDVHVDGDVQKDFLLPFLVDANVTLERVPHVVLDAKGDLDDVRVDMVLGEGEMYLSDIRISPKSLILGADVGIKSGEVKAVLKGDMDSDFARVNLLLDTSLNTNDINDTLVFDLQSDVVPNAVYLGKMLKEQNASLVQTPTLNLHAKGDMKRVVVQSRLAKGEVHYGAFKIFPKKLDLDAVFDVKKQLLDAKLLSLVDSNAANVNLESSVHVNLQDINESLRYKSVGKIIAQKAYVSSQIKDANLSLEKLSPLSIMIEGDAKELLGAVTLDGEVLYNKVHFKPSIENSKVRVDLVKKDVSSQVHVKVLSDKGDVNVDGDVALNLDDLNETMRYDATIMITDAKPFMGVNLSEIGDIMIDAKGSLKDLKAKVKSPKINVDVVSDDFDTFTLKADTKKLYLGKIYEDVPEDLKKSYVAVRGKGFYKLSSKEAKLRAKLKGFKYQNHTLFTNTFNVHLKGDDVTLSPLILQSDKFKLTLDAKKVGEDIVANVQNRTFNAHAKVHVDPLNVVANGEISSIDALIKEIDKVYPMDTKMGIDGKVTFSANMEGSAVRGDIVSKKITLKEGRLEDLHLLALYTPKEVRIKNFDFQLAGFEGKGMNKKVQLAREGIITFDGEDASVDVELKDLLSFKGEKKGDVTTGKLRSKTLMLSYPEYGETKVTTSLDMFQSGGQTAVTGEVRFKETEVNYQSRFLDVSKDSDIIIISKKDKKQKESDDFLQNMFLDIEIVSDDAIVYKVDDGEIEMQPDMRIRKDFGKSQKITGKIKILDGMYDFADKRFKLEEGAVAFRGLKEVNPLLDLHVVYDEIDDVLIKIKIGGDKNRPKLKFSSEPQMSKKDIFSYLLFGMSASETEGAATSANKAAEKIFGRAIAKDLARELHLDRLDMNRNADGGIDVKAGKKVKRKMIIYYQNKSTESSIIVERKLSKSWEVDTEVGKLGQSVDFVYRKGFK